MKFATIYFAPTKLTFDDIHAVEQETGCIIAELDSSALNVHVQRKPVAMAKRVAELLKLQVIEIAS